MSKFRSVAFAFAGMVALVAAAPASPATSLYVQAIRAMGNTPQPEFVAYRLESTSDGLELGLWRDLRKQVWLSSHGGTTPQQWALRHRTFDYQTEIVNEADGHRYTTARSFFDPTWYGALRALREGMFGSQDPAMARELPAPAAAPIRPIKTIGAVSVMGPAVYHVDDLGNAACPSGEPGRLLHLTSIKRDRMHQLTDAIVSVKSTRFCMIRFSAVGAGSGFGIRNGYYEQHYADVGGYWVQTDGVLDGSWYTRVLRKQHGTWRYRLVDMTFPKSLPAETFASP